MSERPFRELLGAIGGPAEPSARFASTLLARLQEELTGTAGVPEAPGQPITTEREREDREEVHYEMPDDKVGYKPLTREELDALAGEPLPERVAMSLINANLAAPINAAVALNVASDDSIAYANAEQDVTIDQST